MSATNSDEFDERWQELKRRFIERLVARLQVIQQSWAELRAGAPDARESLSTLFHQVHSLSGSGATFGFDALSTAARALEPLIDPHKPDTLTLLDAARIGQISERLASLEVAVKAINPAA